MTDAVSITARDHQKREHRLAVLGICDTAGIDGHEGQDQDCADRGNGSRQHIVAGFIFVYQPVQFRNFLPGNEPAHQTAESGGNG